MYRLNIYVNHMFRLCLRTWSLFQILHCQFFSQFYVSFSCNRVHQQTLFKSALKLEQGYVILCHINNDVYNDHPYFNSAELNPLWVWCIYTFIRFTLEFQSMAFNVTLVHWPRPTKECFISRGCPCAVMEIPHTSNSLGWIAKWPQFRTLSLI